jgi:hypothetical protein
MNDMQDDFKRGYASAPRSVFTGAPDDYQTHDLLPGDPIPKGAKSRPWFLGQPETPVTPPEKPKPRKRRKKSQKKSPLPDWRRAVNKVVGLFKGS